MTVSSCPELFVAVAIRLAEASGPIIRSHFRKGFAIDDKADSSPVTIADRDSEAAMRRILNEALPGHGIYGEEFGPENTDAEWVWVLDPVDGTKSFICGVPVFGTLIALLHRGVPVLGVIDQPISRERWVGAKGRPTTLNGEVVTVRPCPDLRSAYLFATAPEMFAGRNAEDFGRLEKAVKGRRFGVDCYAYALLASGHVDLVVEADLKPYDYCALVPVIEGAGGTMTDWRGEPLGLASDGRVVAAGDAACHARALDILGAR